MNKLFVGLLLFVGVIAQYNEVMGEKLFRLSMAAYCKKQFVEKWSCLPCKNSPIVMTNVHTFENSTADTLGFIATSVELNAIGIIFLTQFWFFEGHFLGI